MEVAGRKLEEKDVNSKGADTFCEPCQVENTKTQATGACQECKEYMCTTCFRHHLKGKLCRHHVLLAMDKVSSLSFESSSEEDEKCGKHENEIIKFYCRSHESVGCGDCMVLAHTACKPEYIKDIAKTFQNGDEFKQLMKKLERFELTKKEMVKKIEQNKEENKQMDMKALAEIRQLRSEINDYLDKAEAEIIAEVKQLTVVNRNMQTKLDQEVTKLTSELQEVNHKLDTKVHGEQVVLINSINCKSKVDEIEKMLEDTKNGYILKTFEFCRDDRISDLLQAAQPLGRLRIRHVDKKKVKQSDFNTGVRVRRGPDWKWGNQDGGGAGNVIGFSSDHKALVKWDAGGMSYYRIGQQNAFDLEII